MLLDPGAFTRLCRARDRLAETSTTLSIPELAREAHISPSHFIRRFEAVFGVTPHQFRIQHRLDRAKLLLAAGNHSVTEVCMEVGFSSLGSFSDLFARRVDMPPSTYQRRARLIVPGFELFPGCLNLMVAAFRNFREAGPRALR